MFGQEETRYVQQYQEYQKATSTSPGLLPALTNIISSIAPVAGKYLEYRAVTKAGQPLPSVYTSNLQQQLLQRQMLQQQQQQAGLPLTTILLLGGGGFLALKLLGRKKGRR